MLDEEYYKIAKDALRKYHLSYDEDILQDIVTYMFEKESQFDPSRGQLTTFMYEVVRNRYYWIKNLNNTQKRGAGDVTISFNKEIDKGGHTILDLVEDNSEIVYKRVKQDILNIITPLVEKPLELWLNGMTQQEIQKELNIASQSKVSILINRNIVKIQRYCKKHKIEFKIKEDN